MFFCGIKSRFFVDKFIMKKNVDDFEIRDKDYSLLQRLSYSSPKKCKKLCVKAVNAAINDVCGAVMPCGKAKHVKTRGKNQ